MATNGSFCCSLFKVRKIQTSSCLVKHIDLKGKDVNAQKWIRRQLKDPYVRRSKQENYRCRSAFKLIEIDSKFSIFSPGQIVIDCGGAPGSWTQVAVERVNSLGLEENKPEGKVISVDLQHIVPISGATVLGNSDFTKKETTEKILKILGKNKVDIVMSDMAPNATGVKTMDHEVIIDLCVRTLIFSLTVLKTGGTFLCKLWQGSNQMALENLLKQGFDSVKYVKPPASRSDSAEGFYLARNFKSKS